jgi:predicted transcriptional regulator of viral defense system
MKSGPNHTALYQIAEQRGGYFTAKQAREAGFSWERLSYYVDRKKFERIARGIYRLIHFPTSRFEDLYAALLRAGPRAVISHETALAVYDLSDVLPSQVHVTIPRTGSRRRQGLRLHTQVLDDSDVAMREGLKVTSVPRTIADVATTGLADEQVLQAIEEALKLGLTDEDELRKTADKRGGRPAALIYSVIGESTS